MIPKNGPSVSCAPLGLHEDLLQEQLLRYGLQMSENGAIKWKNGNINHPRNWPWQRKAYDTAVIIFLDLFTYLLAQGLGSLFFPHYSECFGRKQLYISSTFLYAVFCVLVAAVPSLTGVFTGRAFVGFVSAIPSIVVAGSIEDLYDSEARTGMIYLWALVANLGLVIGAIFGTSRRRWLFYMAAAVTLVIQNQDHTPDLEAFFRLVLVRPLRLLSTEPIVFLTFVMSAVAFGLIYLLTAAVPIVHLADSHTLFAGSALSGLALLRSLYSAVFPLFTGPMYRNLGPNMASTILAVVATLFCVCPVLFVKYGKGIRAASPFARSSPVLYNENRADCPVSEVELEVSSTARPRGGSDRVEKD
ncbi:MAG: hypothetical protein Q9216_005991 [Gyalolechia sp. 2 TL-2023]